MLLLSVSAFRTDFRDAWDGHWVEKKGPVERGSTKQACDFWPPLQMAAVSVFVFSSQHFLWSKLFVSS